MKKTFLYIIILLFALFLVGYYFLDMPFDYVAFRKAWNDYASTDYVYYELVENHSSLIFSAYSEVVTFFTGIIDTAKDIFSTIFSWFS